MYMLINIHGGLLVYQQDISTSNTKFDIFK